MKDTRIVQFFYISFNCLLYLLDRLQAVRRLPERALLPLLGRVQVDRLWGRGRRGQAHQRLGRGQDQEEDQGPHQGGHAQHPGQDGPSQCHLLQR